MAEATPAEQASKDLQLCHDTDSLFQKLTDQFDNDTQDARLAWKDIQGLAADSLNHLRERVENHLMTNVRVEFDRTPGASPGMVFKSDAPAPKKPAKNARRVARPRNAFILYRGDWHSETVRQNPGMKNNEISKIIGRQWRFEEDAIKQRYKLLAEDEKRQHAIDHPGYQYQPRKPHEKRKRTGKKKLASAAEIEEQDIRDAYDPVKVQLALPDGTLNFEANFDPGHALEAQIDHWNKTAGHKEDEVPLPIDMYTTHVYNGATDNLPADGVSPDSYVEYDWGFQEARRNNYVWQAAPSTAIPNMGINNMNAMPNVAVNPVMNSVQPVNPFSNFDNQSALVRGISTLFDFDAYDFDTSEGSEDAGNIVNQV